MPVELVVERSRGVRRAGQLRGAGGAWWWDDARAAITFYRVRDSCDVSRRHHRADARPPACSEKRSMSTTGLTTRGRDEVPVRVGASERRLLVIVSLAVGVALFRNCAAVLRDPVLPLLRTDAARFICVWLHGMLSFGTRFSLRWVPMALRCYRASSESRASN